MSEEAYKRLAGYILLRRIAIHFYDNPSMRQILYNTRQQICQEMSSEELIGAQAVNRALRLNSGRCFDEKGWE